MPKMPAGRPCRGQRWSTFLRNQAKAIIACDFSDQVGEQPWNHASEGD